MKKFLSLVLATVLTVGMMTACGESSKTDSSSDSSSNSAQSEASAKDSSETNAELFAEGLEELGKIVEKNAYAFYCDTVADGVRFPSDQPLPIEIGKINATEEHIKKLQENVAKETSDKYKGYVATIAINRKNSELLVYVSISKKPGSEPLYTNFTPEDYI